MAELIGRLAHEADVVIFDSPPGAPVPDALLLSAKVDGVLLVVDITEARRAGLMYASDQFERAGSRLIGLVCNKVSGKEASSYRYYNYHRYYRHGYYGEDRCGLGDGNSKGRENGNLQGEKRRALPERTEHTDALRDG
jgi:Mrp family chromosome partitioning ATPase